MLKIVNISKSFEDGTAQQKILDRLSFAIEAGKSVSIRGASGSGKSTLLHLLPHTKDPSISLAFSLLHNVIISIYLISIYPIIHLATYTVW